MTDNRSGSRPPGSRGFLRAALDSATALIARVRFHGSGSYWETRYRLHGSSGDGSYGMSADFKAGFINDFVASWRITTVIEFGCGDGAQLALLDIPDYLGVDVSRTAVEICRKRFAQDPEKWFVTVADYVPRRADLAMSLDVIYHLVEDDVFEDYMQRLFDASGRYVLIYSTDDDRKGQAGSRHVRHRDVSGYCAKKFPSFRKVSEGEPRPGSGESGPRFLVFERSSGEPC